MSYWINEDINYLPPQLDGLQHNDFDYFVVDDFLDNPLDARNELLKQNFEAPPNPKTGVISFNSPIPNGLLDELNPKITSVLSKRIEFHPRSKCAATYESVPLQQVCHVDGGDNMIMFNWTVVLFLNLPEQCRGGTRLFRHLPTGHNYNKLGMSHYVEDIRDESKWEMVEEVQMKFNRALFLPAWLFHSLAFTFGDTIENARLTVNPKVIAY